MSSTPFTRNYTDHSNGTGFQFEFHCDHCGSGYRSSFSTNKLGVAAGLLSAAGSLFGGAFSNAGWGANEVKDTFRGEAWDRAFAEAIQEIKPRFHQCSRCAKWICPEVCWNTSRGMCIGCAPNLQQEAASVQANVAVEQLWDKARATDQSPRVDMKQVQMASCPHCNARVDGGKFCPSCGKTLASKSECAGCHAHLSAGARFCAECGTPSAG